MKTQATRQRCIFVFVLILFSFSTVFAQKKQIYPTETKAKLTLFLKDFAKKPIAKAEITLEEQEGNLRFSARTNKNGYAEFLVPNGRVYFINIEDSLHFDLVNIKKDPNLMVRHTTYFQGAVNGKVWQITSPGFNMMPPQDGLATIEFHFIGNNRQPLVGEEVTMAGITNNKATKGSTDINGRLVLKVPIGDEYVIMVRHNQNFDHLRFPKNGGSYNAKITYGYAGSEKIDQAIRQRAINDSLYNIYLAKTKDEPRNIRDEEWHKTVFQPVPVRPVTPFLKKTETQDGFNLEMPTSSQVATPFYLNGKIYTNGGFETGEIHCIDAHTGNLEWSLNLGETGASTFSGQDNTVVVVTESCTIYAIDAIAGTLRWSKWLSNYVLSAPTVDNGNVFIAYQDHHGAEFFKSDENENNINETDWKEISHSIACFELSTGEPRWQRWIEGEVISAAVAHENHLYLNTFKGMSYKFDQANGQILAVAENFGTCAPVIRNGTIFMSQRGEKDGATFERMAAFNVSNLSLHSAGEWIVAPWLDPSVQTLSQYRRDTRNADIGIGYIGQENTSDQQGTLMGVSGVLERQSFQGSRPLLYNGRLYVTMGDQFQCLNAETLKPVWKNGLEGDIRRIGGQLASPPALAGGHLILACQNGKVNVVNPANGSTLKQFVTGENIRHQPIVMNGWIYVPSKGKIICLNTHEPRYTGWSAWGGNFSRDNSNPMTGD